MSTKSSLVSVREAAARLGVHESTVRRYADRGLIGLTRLPSGVRRLHRRDVEALATQMEHHDDASLDDLAAPQVWESDEELDRFLSLTYAERDRDR
jgi:excisionase family DNA binding protein